MPLLVVAPDAHDAIAHGAALVDRSEDGKLALTGAQAGEFLAGQVTNDTAGLGEGDGLYAALLTNKGKMLADLRVLHVPGPEPELLLVTERPALQALFDQVRRTIIGWEAELHKRTLQMGLLSLLGPRSRAVAGAEDLPEVEHAVRRGEIAGRPVVLVATLHGVDVLPGAEDVEAVRTALVGAGAVAVPEAAAEVARVEAGRPRYGFELDDSVIPQEAGLNERAVSFTKGCYVGQETVARLFYKGKPNRHLRGLCLDRPAEPGAPLVLDGREVGTLGSVADSPTFGPIALAIVRREAEPGAVVQVGEDGTTARVVELPFADEPDAA